MKAIPIVSGIIAILGVVSGIYNTGSITLILIAMAIWTIVVHHNNVKNNKYMTIRPSNIGRKQLKLKNNDYNILVSLSRLPNQWILFIGILTEFFLTITILASTDKDNLYKHTYAALLPILVCLLIQIMAVYVLSSIYSRAYERDCIEHKKKQNHIKRNILNVYGIAVIIITMFMNIVTVAKTWGSNFTTSSYTDSMISALGSNIIATIIAATGSIVILSILNVIKYISAGDYTKR